MKSVMDTSSRFATALNSALISSLVVGSLLLTGCGGGDQPRATQNSPNLTGLWRMSMDGDTDQIDSTLGFSFTLVDNGSSLKMVSCAGQSTETLTRNGNILTPLISGDATVVNNDTLTSDGEFGKTKSTKMSVNALFDMGTFAFQTTTLGNLNTTNVCTTTVSAKYLGVPALETVTAYTKHNNKILAIELSKVGKFSQTTYSVGTEITDVSIALESELLQTPYRDTRINLSNGTIKITKTSNVWLNGEINAQLPDGKAFTSQFQFEKP